MIVPVALFRRSSSFLLQFPWLYNTNNAILTIYILHSTCYYFILSCVWTIYYWMVKPLIGIFPIFPNTDGLLLIPNCELPSCLLHIFSCIPKWWFPEMGVPPNHPFIDGFSMINHPAIGVSPFIETPNISKGQTHRFFPSILVLFIVFSQLITNIPNYHRTFLTFMGYCRYIYLGKLERPHCSPEPWNHGWWTLII